MFLCDFVLFCANKSIVSAPEGHGIQEVSGSIPFISATENHIISRLVCGVFLMLPAYLFAAIEKSSLCRCAGRISS